jgi:hypothetical protein
VSATKRRFDRYDLPRVVHVRPRIYNVKGELVSTITGEHMIAGCKEIIWNSTNLSSYGMPYDDGLVN